MKVSVLTITYNHEKYIAQAIESVLMQEVNFDYELVIGEDCSTDKTREIVVDYQKKYPNKIRLLLNEKNLGMNRNFAQTYHACRGQYMALLEGDDYWVSPYKLQRQVDFLDNHQDFAICFHNMQIIYEDGSKEPKLYNVNQKEISTIEDLFRDDFIHTASCLFRNKLIGEFPGWFYNLPFGSWPLHISNAKHGKIMYLNEVMGVYRIHRGGVWSGKTVFSHESWCPIYIAEIEFLKIIDKHFRYKYRHDIRQALIPRYISLIKVLISEDNHKKANFYISKLKIIDKYFNYNRKYIIQETLFPRYVSLINELIYKDDKRARTYIFYLLKLGFWRKISNKYMLIFIIWLVSPQTYKVLKYTRDILRLIKPKLSKIRKLENYK